MFFIIKPTLFSKSSSCKNLDLAPLVKPYKLQHIENVRQIILNFYFKFGRKSVLKKCQVLKFENHRTKTVLSLRHDDVLEVAQTLNNQRDGVADSRKGADQVFQSFPFAEVYFHRKRLSNIYPTSSCLRSQNGFKAIHWPTFLADSQGTSQLFCDDHWAVSLTLLGREVAPSFSVLSLKPDESFSSIWRTIAHCFLIGLEKIWRSWCEVDKTNSCTKWTLQFGRIRPL